MIPDGYTRMAREYLLAELQPHLSARDAAKVADAVLAAAQDQEHGWLLLRYVCAAQIPLGDGQEHVVLPVSSKVAFMFAELYRTDLRVHNIVGVVMCDDPDDTELAWDVMEEAQRIAFDKHRRKLYTKRIPYPEGT